MNYDRLQLLDSERAELLLLKRCAPYRQWFAVKPLVGEARFFNSKRAATAYAKKTGHECALYQA